MTITTRHETQHAHLVDQVSALLPQVECVASTLAESAGLPPFKVVVRVTDTFAAEVDSRRADLPQYSTDRVGGKVAAISLRPDSSESDYVVLFNSAALTMEGADAASHMPATLGHELAHCLIEQSRRLHGDPSGYVASPQTPLELVGFIALRVCDEYLADELSKALVPVVSVQVGTSEGLIVEAPDRAVLALDRLSAMRPALDEHVYPALADRVEQYRNFDCGLDALVDELATTVLGALVLAAHFRSATSVLGDDFEGIPEIVAHPAFRLYLARFWDCVAPALDARAGSELADFASQDELCVHAARTGVEGFWEALGITFEQLPDGVFVHVNEPMRV